MSVNSKLGIINSALVLLGQRAATSPTEQTKHTQFANERYDTVRDVVLASGAWNSATTRAKLSVLSTAPVFGFGSQYQLPADFKRLLRLNEDDALDVQYRIEAVSDGQGGATRVLLTDFSEANIVYIFALTEVAKMDELLKYAISARLAYEISLGVKGDIQQTSFLKGLADEAMSNGLFIDALQGPVETMSGDLWLRSRRTAGGAFRSIESVTS